MARDKCLLCLRGFHNQCVKPCVCTHDLREVSKPSVIEYRAPDTDAPNVGDSVSVDESDSTEHSGSSTQGRNSKSTRTRRLKRDDALKDQQSTGRKRAAQLYPLLRDQDCEWANQPSVGGGIPIQGCGLRPGTTVGKQQSRHHGPDYNTLNNDEGNVHRICHSCHNSWHTVNDKNKGEAYLKQYGHGAGGKNFKGSKDSAGIKEDNGKES